MHAYVLLFGLLLAMVLFYVSRKRYVESFSSSDRRMGAFCTGSKCAECESGCCHLAICQPTEVCFGNDQQNYWPRVTLDDGVPLLTCLGKQARPQPPLQLPPTYQAPTQPKPQQQQQQPYVPPQQTTTTRKPQVQQNTGGGGGGGDWKYATMSYYNLGSYEQNDGWPGCTACQGCFGGTDDSWLVAISTKGFNQSMCGKMIRIERTDTGQSVDVPIQDKMMAGDRNMWDVDATPGVARALGFNPTRNNYGPNKSIRWRFL